MSSAWAAITNIRVFEQYKFTFSQFWKQEVHDQGASRAGVQRELSPWVAGAFSLVTSGLCKSELSALLIRTLIPSYQDLAFRTPFNFCYHLMALRSNTVTLGVGASPYFGRHNSACSRRIAYQLKSLIFFIVFT